MPPGEVPVFLWADEAANFVTTHDKTFQEASRSSLCATVFLIQNINNYLAAFSMNAEANAYGLLAGLGTKIFHRNGDVKTNAWAADTIAKAIQIRHSGGTSKTDSTSDGSSSGGSQGGGMTLDSGNWGRNWNRSFSTSKSRSENDNWSEQMDYQVQPEAFTRLHAIGNVQAIIFKSGVPFPPYGLPYTRVSFKQ